MRRLLRLHCEVKIVVESGVYLLLVDSSEKML